MQDSTTRKPNWAYLSNHGHVLVCLARDPNARLRDVAAAVGITERAVQRIVAELEQGGVLMREREGRRNHYTLKRDSSLRHSVEGAATVGDLLDAILGARQQPASPTATVTEFARFG
jgi:predicted ArsR family transcriptional regulator